MHTKLCVALTLLSLICGCRSNTFREELTTDQRVAIEQRGWKPLDVEGLDTEERAGRRAEAAELLARGQGALTVDPAMASGTLERAFRASIEPELAEQGLWLAGQGAYAAGGWRRAHRLTRAYLAAFPRSARYAAGIDRLFDIGKGAFEADGLGLSVVAALEDDDPAVRGTLFVGDTNAQIAIEVLGAFVRDFDRHPSAEEALYMVAEATLKVSGEEPAIIVWQRLMQDYPDGELVDLSEYRIARARLRGLLDPRRDQVPLLTALRALERYLERYPTGDRARAATVLRAELVELLSAHALAVADYYAYEDKPEAERVYLQDLVRRYPSSAAAREARRRLDAPVAD